MHKTMIGVAGLILILGFAVLISSNRRAIRLRVVSAAFALQAGIAILVLYVPWGRQALAGLAGSVTTLLGYSQAGTTFIFGPLATDRLGQSFALQALPVIIFFTSIVSILYHLGIMQLLIRWIGGGLERILGISRIESLYSAANIFLGQSESPLVIRPHLSALAPSQLFTVMVVGMAGVAGTILAAYAALGIRVDYLLAASFMSAPGGILMAKIVMPDEPGAPVPDLVGDGPRAIIAEDEERSVNIIMAAAQGAQTGVKLAVAVGALVLAFVALVALANGLLSGIGAWFGMEGLTFQRVVGYLLAPLMWLLNVPWDEAVRAGGLFGEKLVLNEFVAFLSLQQQQAALSPRTIAVVTFALCGFANLSSIAVQMAVTGGLAPDQRSMIARLGLRALVAASLANLTSAALAGMLVGD